LHDNIKQPIDFAPGVKSMPISASSNPHAAMSANPNPMLLRYYNFIAYFWEGLAILVSMKQTVGGRFPSLAPCEGWKTTYIIR
jgi:hypothetical protein